MSSVVDASVFVAAIRSKEVHNADSVRFLNALRLARSEVLVPTLALTETVAAIGRTTGDPALVRLASDIVEAFPGILLAPLDHPCARRAAELAAIHRLRGADAVYLAVAQEHGATLVTWDNEMLQRCPSVLPTMTPTEWLAANAAI